MAGRPAKPSELKKLQGTYRPDRAPNEPTPARGRPSCPAELTGAARKEWGRIAKQLDELGLLTQVDRTALAAYCVAYSHWLAANEMLQKPVKEGGGMVVYSANGYPSVSPHWTASQQASKQMLMYLREFGMTPAARSRLSVPQTEKVQTLGDMLDEVVDE